MEKQFVTEAIMFAIYGELMSPESPVEYFIPSSSVYELNEFYHSPEPIMQSHEDERLVREHISQMIHFFQDPFKRKKMEKSLVSPWSTVTFPFDHNVSLTIVKAEDTAAWGELFDPIETELMLTAMRFSTPLLTDQTDWQERMIENMVPVQVYDIDDFAFAVEQGISLDDLRW